MPGPKTRSTKKNTAPKGVAPIGPSNENYLFPGVPSSVVEPRKISWPQITSNPSDRGYLEPYDPLTGLPTGQAPINPYIPQWQPYTMYGPPMPPMPPAASATPTSAAPNVPPSGPATVDPYFIRWQQQQAAQELAPKLSTGGSGSYGKPDYNYWYDMAQNQEQWTPEEQAAYLAQFYGQTDENGNLIGVGNPRWGDPYQVMPYWKYNQNTWVGGREGGASSKGGGRMPSRYYIPEQQFYKTPGGRTYASRDGYKDAFGEDENPPGNNKNLSIPAWVGPLVSWRT